MTRIHWTAQTRWTILLAAIVLTAIVLTAIAPASPGRCFAAGASDGNAKKQTDPDLIVPDAEPQTNLFRITPRDGMAHLDLSEDWQFGWRDTAIKRFSELATIEKWYVMHRPTSVQRALQATGDYPDPYAAMNSKLYEWCENKVWYFKKTFTLSKVPAAVVKDGYAFLSFDGLDYFSSVMLNGQYLGRHEGMFGGPEFEIGALLRVDRANELVVAVASANCNNPQYSARDPGRFVKPWSTSGGTGVEPFFSLGFWRGARLDLVPKTHLERPYLVTKKIDSGGTNATLGFETELFVGTHSLEQTMYPPKNRQLVDFSRIPPVPAVVGPGVVRLTLEHGGKTFVREFPVTLNKGRSWLRREVALPNPELWWPNGLGEQPLYRATVTLSQNGKTLDSVSFDFGIRTIEWVESAGEKVYERWTDWQCVVNGKKTFLKGCNWMPADTLLDLPGEKYRWRLAMAQNAGIQILRVWGPGLQESEEFYNACDRFGIMVWQDFPMGNWDAHDWIHEIAESQFLQTIWRLRNRASLAVWCGGNEFNPYCRGNTAVIGLIERNLSLFDPSRKFLRTSPDCGSYHTYPDMDATWYKKCYKAFPYLAESGMHTVASSKSLAELIDPAEFKHVNVMYKDEYRKLAPESTHHFVEYYPSRVPRMLSRASHIVEMDTMQLDDMAIGTQLGAAEFYQAMVEGVSANYPVTTGMMPWVFARSWPVISAIQLVDGTGQPVVPYYTVKRCYEPRHVMLDIDRCLWKPGETFPVRVKALNLGTLPAFRATVSLRILDPGLRTIYASGAQELAVPQGPATAQVDFKPFTIPNDYRNRIFFAIAEMKIDGKTVSRSVYHPRTVPQMDDQTFHTAYTRRPVAWPAWVEGGPRLRPTIKAAPKTTLSFHVAPVPPTAEKSKAEKSAADTSRRDGRYRIGEYTATVKNTGDQPSILTWLELDTPKTKFYASDNYFFLDKGEEKTVTVRVRQPWSETPAPISLRVASWNADVK